MTDIAVPNLEDPKENWLVYADALQSSGDARGELIMLNAAVAEGSTSSDRDAYLERHADAIYGSLAPHRAKLEVAWKWCVPLSLSVKIGPSDDAKALIQAVLDSPLGKDMRSLSVIGQTPEYANVNLADALALLREGLPSSCTAIELIDERAKQSRMLVSSDYDPGRNLVDFGSLDVFWAIPQLEKLHLIVADPAQVELGTIEAPALRDFSLLGLRWAESYGGPTSMSATLAAAEWPKLESLALRLPETFTYSWPDQYGAYVPEERYEEESDEYDDDDGWNEPVNWSEELEGLLANLSKTSIKRLSLTSFASGRQLLEAFENHGLPSTLETLDLSHSDLTDDDAAWIAAHPGLFGQLKVLDLSETPIDDASGLASLGPQIVHSSGSGAIYRFSVGME